MHRPDADARLSTVSTRLWSLVVDAADPVGLARFWSAALGWPIVFAASDQDEVVVAPAEPLIFTTNYDELIEDAHAAAGLLIRVSANEDESKAHAAQLPERHLVGLHGSIDRPDTIVLTRNDYSRARTSRREMLLHLRHELAMVRSCSSASA